MMKPILFALLSTMVINVNAQDQSTHISTEATCAVTGGNLVVQTIIETDYEYLSKETGAVTGQESDRVFWTFVCSIENRTCRAFLMRLDNIDQGQPIGLLDAALPVGLEIVAVSGDIYTLTWGPWRRLTVDLQAEIVQYLESAPNTKGVGQGVCPNPFKHL
jgi:hypothetical protein